MGARFDSLRSLNEREGEDAKLSLPPLVERGREATESKRAAGYFALSSVSTCTMPGWVGSADAYGSSSLGQPM